MAGLAAVPDPMMESNDEVLDRLVKLAGEAIANNDDHWEFADALVEEMPDVGRPTSSHTNDGSYVLLDKLSQRIEIELGVRKKPTTLRHIRATAAAFPSEVRNPDVSFEVHSRLRGKPGKLPIYKRRAEADHKRSPGLFISPKLTKERLQAYRNEEKPFEPWVVQMEKKVRRMVKEAMSQEALGELERIFNQAVNQRMGEVSSGGGYE